MSQLNAIELSSQNSKRISLYCRQLSVIASESYTSSFPVVVSRISGVLFVEREPSQDHCETSHNIYGMKHFWPNP